jgi:hypothetical protein
LLASAGRTHRASKRQSNSTVDDATIKQCPRINGPSPVCGLKRTHERIVSGLPNSAKVFNIDE